MPGAILRNRFRNEEIRCRTKIPDVIKRENLAWHDYNLWISKLIRRRPRLTRSMGRPPK